MLRFSRCLALGLLLLAAGPACGTDDPSSSTASAASTGGTGAGGSGTGSTGPGGAGGGGAGSGAAGAAGGAGGGGTTGSAGGATGGEGGGGGCSSSPVGGGDIHFDELANLAIVDDHYLSLGVQFSAPSTAGAPLVFGMFASPASPPNFLIGEDESADLNPGFEHGNNTPALPITMTFVVPGDPSKKAITPSVSFREIFSNTGNVTRAEGYDASENLVASAEIIGDSLAPGKTLTLSSASGIHRVVVLFDAIGTGGLFEDSAGIDDVQFEPVVAVCP